MPPTGGLFLHVLCNLRKVGTIMKKAVYAVLAVAVLAGASYAYARPAYGNEYDIVDASGNVIGGAEFTCSARWYTWGDTNGTMVLVNSYPCY